MTNKTKGFLIGIGGFLILALIVFIMGVSYNNKEVAISNKIDAQQKVCESFFDKMFKIIQQKAQVADEYKEAFKDIYPKLIAGRYDKGDGSLMKWITEANPTFDVSLYQGVQQSIEAERNSFNREQTQLIDYKREHDNIRKQIPSRWFIGNVPEKQIVLVTSDRTEEAFKTGKDNDIEIFSKVH